MSPLTNVDLWVEAETEIDKIRDGRRMQGWPTPEKDQRPKYGSPRDRADVVATRAHSQDIYRRAADWASLSYDRAFLSYRGGHHEKPRKSVFIRLTGKN